ncbi:quinone oxidoreductase-like protein 1 isoform X2 [Nannospalax galili]|uniref:quinone oxidoreductase-like protein 1 isoform X2 n=1 Tax=Nannospalax galili TaxID=1026970 RepID=UPI00111C37DE|nr:quinone oxidoreductase-like protein 1 isoform X2 [Nannospalax galili]
MSITWRTRVQPLPVCPGRHLRPLFCSLHTVSGQHSSTCTGATCGHSPFTWCRSHRRCLRSHGRCLRWHGCHPSLLAAAVICGHSSARSPLRQLFSLLRTASDHRYLCPVPDPRAGEETVSAELHSDTGDQERNQRSGMEFGGSWMTVPHSGVHSPCETYPEGLKSHSGRRSVETGATHQTKDCEPKEEAQEDESGKHPRKSHWQVGLRMPKVLQPHVGHQLWPLLGSVHKPAKVPWTEAAGTIRDGVRAYTALHYLSHLSPGKSVLIMDGVSAFGTIAIQLAHHRGAKVISTAHSLEDKQSLEKLRPSIARVIDVSNGKVHVVEGCLEETGGLGVDIVLDAGVRLYSKDDEPAVKLQLPHKHDIIALLGVGGRWVTTEENLQLDPPDSHCLFLKGATVAFLNDEVWNLANAQQGKYLFTYLKRCDGEVICWCF